MYSYIYSLAICLCNIWINKKIKLNKEKKNHKYISEIEQKTVNINKIKITLNYMTKLQKIIKFNVWTLGKAHKFSNDIHNFACIMYTIFCIMYTIFWYVKYFNHKSIRSIYSIF